jgi:glycosyltransferase involved in cell wall biosynthesis
MNLLMLGEGTSIHQQRIARGLASEGARIVFAGFSPSPLPGIEMLDLARGTGGARGLRFARKVRLLRSLTRAHAIDLIHAHYITVYGVLALAAGSIPKLLTVHGSDVLQARRTLYNRCVIRAVARGMDRITSPSAQVTEALLELGAPPDRIETFQYGVDLERFHPAPPPRSGRAPLRIISMRRLAPLYRVDVLLMALSRMVCRAEVRATIAGEGPEAPALMRLAWSLQLDEEVAFVGALDEPGVALALRQADVYVSTSPTDGASLSLLEAMATGLLPVATDIPANRAWIRDGENGLLFPPGSPDALAGALLRAVHEPGLREKARTLNPAIIRERANFDFGIRRFREIYEALLEGRGGGRAS